MSSHATWLKDGQTAIRVSKYYFSLLQWMPAE